MIATALPPPLARRPPPPPVGLPDDAADGALALALSLLERDPYALSLDLADIELPPAMGGTAEEQARLRAVAPLYLASELESTRLVPAVEMLAGLAVSGGLPGDPGPAAQKLLAFRRAARDRLTAGERDALFGRLFGKPYGPALAGPAAGRNHAFEARMIDLCEALSMLETEPGVGTGIRVHTAASALSAALLPPSGGATEFAARDCLETLRDALEILKAPRVQAMFGARGVWAAVREVARRYLGEQTDIVSRVARGRAGTTILAWLAESLPRVGDTRSPLVPAGSEIPGAAVGWMEATLTLHETSPTAAAQAAAGRAA
jgi:hypothetical protein